MVLLFIYGFTRHLPTSATIAILIDRAILIIALLNNPGPRVEFVTNAAVENTSAIFFMFINFMEAPDLDYNEFIFLSAVSDMLLCVQRFAFCNESVLVVFCQHVDIIGGNSTSLV